MIVCNGTLEHLQTENFTSNEIQTQIDSLADKLATEQGL